MKRSFVVIVSALIAAASVCSLAGCGSKEASQAQSAAASAASSAVAAADAGNGAFSDTDVVANIKGVNVELNTEIEPIVEALGEPKDVSSQTTCHGTEGEDKTYTYDGFTIMTYPKDGKDLVLEVNISSADIASSKGVKVGDPVSAVTASYGEPSKKVGVYYSYSTADNKSLQFMVENDVVTEIDYFYTV